MRLSFKVQDENVFHLSAEEHHIHELIRLHSLEAFCYARL